MSIVGIASLAFAWSCSTTTTTTNTNSAKAPASNSSNATNSSASSSAAPATSAKKADIKATAEDLAKEYKADPKSAEKYKDKVVEITGKFNRSSGTTENPEVQFETGSSVWVTCVLSPSAYQAAAKFEKGQEVKLVGTTDPYSITGPRFKNCEIAQ